MDGTLDGEVEVEGLVGRLRGVLDAAVAAPVGSWSAAAKAAWLLGLHRERARLEALCADAAVAADGSGVPLWAGAGRTMRQWVNEQPGVDPETVVRDLTLGRLFVQFPVLADAVRAGELRPGHVRAVERMDTPATAALLRDNQAELAAAGEGRWQDFTDACGRLLVHGETSAELADARVRNRTASLTTNGDGTVTGRFTFDPIVGAATKAAFDREVARLVDADNDADHPDSAHRTPGRRAADALAGLITNSNPNTAAAAAAPLMHVVIGEDVLAEELTRRAAAAAGVDPVGVDGQPLDDLRIDPHDPLRRCELIDGTPLHPSQAVALLTRAEIRRIVFSVGGEILDHGRKVRLYPRHMRLALLVKHRGRCAEPGCDAPVAWLQGDHITPWSRGGTTDITNGAILCAACNKAKRDRDPGRLRSSEHGPPPDVGDVKPVSSTERDGPPERDDGTPHAA